MPLMLSYALALDCIFSEEGVPFSSLDRGTI